MSIKTLSRTFKISTASQYCEKMPCFLWEQVVWEQRTPVIYAFVGVPS